MASDKRGDAEPMRLVNPARELTTTADTINVDPQALANAIPGSGTLADRCKVIRLLERSGLGAL